MKRHEQELDRYLSGAQPLEELPHDLRVEEERLRGLLGALREDVRASHSLREGIMRRVTETPLPRWKRLSDWVLRPRTLRVTPAAGALAVAASALLLSLWSGPSPAVAPSALPAADATRPGAVMTRFVFVAPEVGSVHVTGDFLSWDPEGLPLEDIRGTGVWTADVALPPGIYQYTFIVDGTKWQPDPRAVSQVSDGFGELNSVLIVSARAEA